MINKLKKIAQAPAWQKWARRGGFTLIETLVAVLLLSIAIAGPLTIASKGLASALISKDQIGAFYLGQDAVEYVRFVRDSNTLGVGDWLTGAGAAAGVNLSACEGANGCYLDSTNQSPAVPTACASTPCTALNYDKSLNRYTYAAVGGSIVQTPERYIRTVKITTPVGSNTNEVEASVSVVVQWTGANGAAHSVTYNEDILNWQ